MDQPLPMSIAASLSSKLKDARKAAGLSTREVAERLSNRYKISHATISNIERGVSTPNVELLSILADVYQRPINWFLGRGRTLSGFQYRNKKSQVRVGDLRRYEADSHRWLEAYLKLEEHLGSRLECRHLDLRSEIRAEPRGDKAAQLIRARLSLRDDPIPSVAELLTDFGVRTIEMPTELAIDGFAAHFGDEPAVILNPRVPNDRARLNAGHELGHILFGDCEGSVALNSKAAEVRVFEFGSHLLLPESQLVKAFHGQSMVKLVHYKERFGISLAAMVMRATRARLISESVSKWLWIEFAKRGWRKTEPGVVRPDRATRFEDLLARAVADERLTWRRAADLMGVREDEINLRISIALGGNPDNEEDLASDVIPIR